MAESTITLSRPEADIAVLTFDSPGQGGQCPLAHVLEEFDAKLNELTAKPGLAGLIIRSGKPGAFIAGADITEFAAAKDITKAQVIDMCTRGRKLLQRLSQVPFVTVAAIDGVALGGGAELSSWCDRRVMSNDRKAQFGFPEVKIGIYPGWGGTARVPRMIGLFNAVELIAGGEAIDGKAAQTLGLVFDVVPADHIQQAAIAVIRAEQKSRAFLQDRERWSGPLPIDDTELGFLAVTTSAFIQGQTKGQYPAPIAALNTMIGAAKKDVDAACQMEAEGMAELFGTPINKALINVFFLMERNKKDTGVDRADVKPATIKSVGVFGAGIMGAGIAAAAVRKKLPVTINDAMPEALAKGVRGILEEVSFDKTLRGPSGPKMLEALRWSMLRRSTRNSPSATW